VIGVLTESENPRKYCSVLKTSLKKKGSEVATNCSRLKLLEVDATGAPVKVPQLIP